jgi:nitrogen fixation NifU-like protein
MAESETAYRQMVLDRYHQPRFRGELTAYDRQSQQSNPLCGDQLKLQLKVTDGRVTAVGWTGEGCAISQASADLLSEQLVGQPLEALANMSEDRVIGLLGMAIRPARRQCATLSLACLRQCLAAGANSRA